ncbi:MAG TPA: tetratricopeptide repeat protein [Gemmatimonadales bacterium]|nr:tetratricopeptide repeat protein [Gemmatimonadales bacterium]
MAYTSEIDKLEARYRDNPKGRNFAPLADAYRKAGLIDNAIELCQNGLKLHPDYVSAYIVYARCLVDKKDQPAAEGVFKQVLDLDRENIIALRGLAELAERTGKYAEEVEWLTRLLNADPMNGDAAEALARAKSRAANPPGTAPDAATAPMAKPDFTVEHEETPETKLTAAPGGEIDKFENPIAFNPNAHAAAKADGLEVLDEVELNPQQIERVEVEGLAPTQYEGSGIFQLDAPEPSSARQSAPDLDEALPAVDLPLIMPDEETAGPPVAPPPPPRVPAAVASTDDDGAADTATLSQAEPVVTETMAELYLKQGHQQDALRVYQALLAQKPHDAKLRRKVEQLSSGAKKQSGVSAQTFLKGIWSGKGAPQAAAEPQSTLAAAFDVARPSGSVSAGEPSDLPGEPADLPNAAESSPGAPSRPAGDHISLDSVFGDDASRQPAAEWRPEIPEPEPAPPAPPLSGDGSKTGGFSFDDFFGAKGGATVEGGSNAPESASPRTPGASRTSGRTQRPPEDEAEADQFQKWLKKLKS